MSDLTEFLLARIYEDEHNDTTLIGSERKNWHTRWLAECEAKRRIVNDAATFQKVADEESGPDAATRLVSVGIAKGYSLALSALALPYADHADYRDEWKP